MLAHVSRRLRADWILNLTWMHPTQFGQLNVARTAMVSSVCAWRRAT